MAGDRDRFRTIAGLSLVGVGIVSILGIITAEAFYPGYDPTTQTISTLGAASGPGGAVQPAATIFNGAMIVSGLLILVAAYGIHRVYDHRWLTAVVALSGLGVAGVGLFPAQYSTPHLVAALVAFATGGLGAILVALVVRGPFRYLLASLGVVSLVALVGFVTLGGSTVLGIGGLERWITYPVQIWVTAFGGYLLGSDVERSERSVSEM